MWWHTVTHGKGKWRGNWRIEWVAKTLHTTSEHGVPGITTADTHTSAASSRLNWHPTLVEMDSSVSPKDEILVSARVPSHFIWPVRIFEAVLVCCLKALRIPDVSGRWRWMGGFTHRQLNLSKEFQIFFGSVLSGEKRNILRPNYDVDFSDESYEVTYWVVNPIGIWVLLYEYCLVYVFDRKWFLGKF